MSYKLGYYGAKLIASFEFPHGIQTRPERDVLGIPTIMGMTALPDGRKVTMDMEFTETEIVELYGERQKEFVDCVNQSLRIDVNQHQFDALVAMAFNVGAGAFSDEDNNTVLRMTNQGEFENASAAFGKWVYGTLHGGKKGPDDKPARGPSIVYANGQQIELDGGPMQKGQKWKKAFGGLYRRHVSEALLFCSLDWERAAHPDNIHLTKRTEQRSFGFYDIVRFKTPWKKIKEDAKYDVLPLAVEEDEEMFEPTKMERLQYESAKAAGVDDSLNEYVAHRRGLVMPVGKKPLSINTKQAEEVPYGIDPKSGGQPKEEAERFKRAVKKEKGLEMKQAGQALTVATGVVAGANQFAGETRSFLDGLGTLGLVLLGLAFGAGVLWWVVGWARERWNERKEFEAEVNAKQWMY